MQDSDVKELFSAIRMLKDKMDKVVVLVENVEKQIKELKKEDLAQKENSKKILDPYSKENFIIRGDYIELKEPVGNIKMIERWRLFYPMPWKEAIEYAKNLRIGGFNDWRVPTREELIVIERMKKVCGIDRCDEVFWSSSTSVRDTNYAWIVDFNNGYVYSNNKTYDGSVRCVR